MTEPANAAEVASWIDRAQRERDPFEHVRAASHAHRAEHGPGCTVYPTSSGPLLSVLAAALGATRVLEVGCGLGYSALCLARGAPGHVETVERDAGHARLAEARFAAEGYGDRIRVLVGRAVDVFALRDEQYDLIFSDADPEEMPELLGHFLRLLRPPGVLVSANLFLAQFVEDLPGLDPMVEYRSRLLAEERLLTALLPGGLALSTVRS